MNSINDYVVMDNGNFGIVLKKAHINLPTIQESPRRPQKVGRIVGTSSPAAKVPIRRKLNLKQPFYCHSVQPSQASLNTRTLSHSSLTVHLSPTQEVQPIEHTRKKITPKRPYKKFIMPIDDNEGINIIRRAGKQNNFVFEVDGPYKDGTVMMLSWMMMILKTMWTLIYFQNV